MSLCDFSPRLAKSCSASLPETTRRVAGPASDGPFHWGIPDHNKLIQMHCVCKCTCCVRSSVLQSEFLAEAFVSICQLARYLSVPGRFTAKDGWQTTSRKDGKPSRSRRVGSLKLAKGRNPVAVIIRSLSPSPTRTGPKTTRFASQVRPLAARKPAEVTRKTDPYAVGLILSKTR